MSASAELDHVLEDLSDSTVERSEAEEEEEYSYDLPVFGVGLKIPRPSGSAVDRVILLCTKVCCGAAPPPDEEEEEESGMEVDGKVLKELEVTKVLFETPPSLSGKHAVIFQCARADGDTLCLKLMDRNDIYQSEKRAYERMMARGSEGSASDMFLKVHFFCEVIMPDKRVWKGYCMEEGKYSLRDIFYAPSSDPISGALEQNKIFADILRDKAQQGTPSSSSQPMMYYCSSAPKSKEYVWEKGGQGVKVQFTQTQSIQMSIAIAALRLLHRLHTVHGWVHGDSHLGNFMYRDQRVYAIDFERSFRSHDPVQHLMDTQEFFGHFSGILLHAVRCNDWDMRDIFGLYYYRHPLVKTENEDVWAARSSNFSRRKTLFMLPVCTCFTCPTEEMRLKGCTFCKSPLNTQSAKFVEARFEEVLEDMSEWGLSKMKSGLGHTRTVTLVNQCNRMVDLIFPLIQDGSVLTTRDAARRETTRRVRRRIEVDEKSSSLNPKLVAEMTRGKPGCFAVLKRLLYMPTISKRAHRMIKEIVTRLSDAGLTEAADALWANVANPL